MRAFSEFRNLEIDRLRGLAILFVIWHHLSISILSPYVPFQFSRTWTGVDLFFVISGFVVTGSLLRLKKESERHLSHLNKKKVWSTFVRRRFTRILPMAWLWAIIPLLLTFAPNGEQFFSSFNRVAREVIPTFFFINNYSDFFTGLDHIPYYWSLAVEEHFYLLLPIILLLFEDRKVQIVICTFLVSFIAIGRPFLNPYPFNAPYSYHFLSHNRFDSLFCGVILILANERINAGFMKLNLSHVLVSFTCYLCSILLFSIAGLELIDLNLELVIFMIASGLLVFCASLEQGYIYEIPRINRILELAGGRSFSLYLIHMPAIWLAKYFAWLSLRGHPKAIADTILNTCIQFSLFLFLLGLMTYINFEWVEMPLIRLSKRISC